MRGRLCLLTLGLILSTGAFAAPDDDTGSSEEGDSGSSEEGDSGDTTSDSGSYGSDTAEEEEEEEWIPTYSASTLAGEEGGCVTAAALPGLLWFGVVAGIRRRDRSES
jgi:hypothetical protein